MNYIDNKGMILNAYKLVVAVFTIKNNKTNQVRVDTQTEGSILFSKLYRKRNTKILVFNWSSI